MKANLCVGLKRLQMLCVVCLYSSPPTHQGWKDKDTGCETARYCVHIEPAYNNGTYWQVPLFQECLGLRNHRRKSKRYTIIDILIKRKMIQNKLETKI